MLVGEWDRGGLSYVCVINPVTAMGAWTWIRGQEVKLWELGDSTQFLFIRHSLAEDGF